MCSRTIDGLADEITALASHIHAATCRWLGLVAEFERRGGGRLSYSKVRALTRVESVVEEEKLLSLARHATAAQLERLVRAYRGVVARAKAAEYGGPERWLRWDHADDGSLLLRARLPAEEGAVVLEALQAGVQGVEASPGAPAAEARALNPVSAEAPTIESVPGEPLAD